MPSVMLCVCMFGGGVGYTGTLCCLVGVCLMLNYCLINLDIETNA